MKKKTLSLFILTLAIGGLIFPHFVNESFKSVQAEGANVTATNLKINKNLGTRGFEFDGDRVKGIYIDSDANDAPSNSNWSYEYNITSPNNMSLLKANGTYIENLCEGRVGTALIVKLNSTSNYFKFESWTIGNNRIESGDTLTIRGIFTFKNDNSYKYEIEETSFLIKTEEEAIVITDTVNDIKPTAVSKPEYNDQCWHFQFLAKGVSDEVMPFTNGSNNDSYSYIATVKYLH